VSSNNHLVGEVLSRIAHDPRIPDPVEVAVSDDEGAITLRGTVESFAQRRAAVQDAFRVDGVYRVDDALKVRVLDRREDDEIRGVALQALIWDAELPAGSIDVQVRDGWLTLNGQVEFQFQSDAAFDDVASLLGVAEITNEIKVITPA
jgi:osmotically-inducible protein OsmY